VITSFFSFTKAVGGVKWNVAGLSGVITSFSSFTEAVDGFGWLGETSRRAAAHTRTSSITSSTVGRRPEVWRNEMKQTKDFNTNLV
jgi:hypothetical protein